MRYLTLALILCLAALPVRSLAIGSLAAAETYPPIALEGTQQRDMKAKSSGETFRIFIRKPQVAAPPEGYPVIYAVGANANFLYFVNLMRTGAENPLHPKFQSALIVGIGFPTDKAYDVKRWIRDFTLPAKTYDMPDRPNGNRWPTMGGADETLDFIENELKPAIDRDFDVDASREILFGHSFGGLFTLHALFTRPDLFDTYLAASPSVWFNDRQIVGELKRFAARPPEHIASKRLVVGVGGNEQGGFSDSDEKQAAAGEAKRPQDSGMVERARDLTRHLKQTVPGLDTEFISFPGDDHGSVLPTFILRVLPEILATKQP